MKFQYDFRTDIIDSTADNSLKIIIDKIEPEAPWLMTSPMNPTELIGVVPMDAVGQIYQLTLHANNAIGGSSDPVTIPLQINTDEIFKPHFYLDKPQLPPLYKGQPYFFDFTQHEEVYPRYEDLPYRVELAANYPNPAWLHIENNQISIDKVPDFLKGDQTIFLTIQNIPGGLSDVLAVNINLVN